VTVLVEVSRTVTVVVGELASHSVAALPSMIREIA
jgi:hypothetical protein